MQCDDALKIVRKLGTVLWQATRKCITFYVVGVAHMINAIEQGPEHFAIRNNTTH